MTPSQFQRVKALYLQLESVAPEQREAQLDQLCGDDRDVRAQVLELLNESATSDEEVLSRVGGQFERVLADSGTALVGQRIGAYEIESVLGHGGMGIVYRARDSRLGRGAALKALLPSSTDREGDLERFRREARVLASLSHPNIATVFGLEEAHDTFFLAMELIEGKTLAERVGRSPMPIEAALETCQQVAAALEAAHDEGIIHRDLKPANIMFTGDDVVKVLDFGLARRITASDSPSALTKSITAAGSLYGTPAYMSPEQARGEPLDQRSDIFSFGAVLYKCLTGRSPFGGETSAEVIESVLTRDPEMTLLPPALPRSVRSILSRCLAKRPADRYRHIGDVRLDLRDAMDSREWERRPQNSSESGAFHRVLPWAAAAVIAVALAAIVAMWRSNKRDTSHAEVQRFDLTLPSDSAQRDLERLQLAISPDGESIVVACQTAEGQALWIRAHRDGQWNRIDGTQDAHRPAFTRDGQWVLFYRNNYIYKQRISGRGEPARLAASTNWYGVALADDGRIIYSPAWGAPLSVLSPDAAGENGTPLSADPTEVSRVSPNAVPDSPWILYSAWFGGEECTLAALNLKSGQTKRVASNASCGRVAKTPRGDYLLFERSSIIFAAPFDRATAAVSGPETAIAEGVLNDGTRFASYFDVADNGTLVYFAGNSFAEESRLASINADGTSEPIHDDRMSFIEPTFSTDGKVLAVGIKGKIYRALLYNLAQHTRQFITTGGDTLSCAIHPQGEAIALTVNRDGGYGIDLHSLSDGRRLRRLLPPGADYPSHLTYSPDGRYVCFAMSPAVGNPRDIWVVDAEQGGPPKAVVNTPGADTIPSFSPDGRWLAYSSDISGKSEIYLVAFPGAEVTRQITSSGGESPIWSPDGKRIYYISDRRLLMLDISPEGLVTGEPRVFYSQPFGQSDPLGKNFTVAPDGRVIVVEPSERRPTITHLHAITHWYELLPK